MSGSGEEAAAEAAASGRARELGEVEDGFVDPAAGRDIFLSVTDDHAVAKDRSTLRELR